MINNESSEEDMKAFGSNGNIQEFYNLGSRDLGHGTFGTVRQASCFATGKFCAVKVVVKSAVKDAIWDFRKEVEISRHLDHPNIIKVFEIFEDFRRAYLVMELCEGFEMLDHLLQFDDFSEARAAVVMAQVLDAAAYMHGRHVCHRDLKPENFIFVLRGPLESTPIKLIDFGLARRFEPGEVLRTAVGTILYVAPEVYMRKYRESCDLWSIGTIMHLLLSGRPPFDGDSAKEVVRAVRKVPLDLCGECWSSVSDHAKDLVSGLLTKEPAKRLTVQSALQHPWIREMGLSAQALPSLGTSLLERLRHFSEKNHEARGLHRLAKPTSP